MYVLARCHQASVHICPRISAHSIHMYVFVSMYVRVDKSRVDIYVPVDSCMCVHIRKCIYVKIGIVKPRQVIHTHTHVHTYCHMPRKCEAHTHTWASNTRPPSPTKPPLFCLTLKMSAVMFMFKLPYPLPPYTPEPHSIRSALGWAPHSAVSEACIGFPSANPHHVDGSEEQLGPCDMRI